MSSSSRRYYIENKAACNARARAWRAANRDRVTATNRLPHNVVARAYANIIRRTTGRELCASTGLAVGFTRDEFALWTLSLPAFWRLFELWKYHNYARAWSPSIDRLIDSGGYVPGNVQWIVWYENNKKARLRQTTKFRKANNLPLRATATESVQ